MGSKRDCNGRASRHSVHGVNTVAENYTQLLPVGTLVLRSTKTSVVHMYRLLCALSEVVPDRPLEKTYALHRASVICKPILVWTQRKPRNLWKEVDSASDRDTSDMPHVVSQWLRPS